jgi:hypothetical protein
MPPLNLKLMIPKGVYIVLGIFTLANIVTTIKVVTDANFFNSSDFMAYSTGAQIILDGKGQDIYKLEIQKSYWEKLQPRDTPYILPYIAPPTTALFYIPYLFLPANIRAQVATLVNFLPILAGAFILGKVAKDSRLALLSIFSSWFVWVCVWQIQPTALLFLVTAILYAALTKKNNALSGVLCAFYIIKPHYLIIVPLIFLLTGKNVTFVKTFLASLLVLLAINLSITGTLALFVDYPKLLTTTDNPNYGNRWYEMYSIQQVTYRISRFFVDSKIPPLIIGALFYLWGLIKINKLANSRKTITNLFPIAVIVALLSAYHVLPQDMSLISISVFLISSVCIKGNHESWAWKLLVLQLLGFVVVVGSLANYYTLIIALTTWSISKRLLNRKNILPTKGEMA